MLFKNLLPILPQALVLCLESLATAGVHRLVTFSEELKLNRLVLKLNSGKLTGGNEFKGDIIAILKDFEEMRAINDGKKYLFLLMQNQGVKIGNSYKLSLNEYAEKKPTNESKKLISLIENKEDNAEVLFDKIIYGKVNHNQLPFRMLLFEIN